MMRRGVRACRCLLVAGCHRRSLDPHPATGRSHSGHYGVFSSFFLVYEVLRSFIVFISYYYRL